MADENDTLNIEEQGGNTFEDSFNEFAGGEKPEVIKKPEASEEEDNVQKKEDAVEKNASEEESAMHLLSKRANEFTGVQSPQTEQKPVEHQKVPEEKKEEKGQEIPADFNFENFVKGLPDGEVEISGRKINPKEYLKDFPDEAAFTMFCIQNAMKTVKLPNIPASLKDERFDGFSKDFTEFREQYSHERFMSGVERRHPDVKEIISSEEFKEWVGKQSPGIQKLGDESNDVEDADYILKAFKEEKEKRSAGGENKLKKLYKNTLKGQGGGGKPKTNAAGNDDDEFGDAFNEFASSNK